MDGKIPEYFIRVKLPSPSGFASCPSGDTAYEEAFRSAIFAVKPTGFEVKYPRTGEAWPVDSSGMTWVPLYCNDTQQLLPGLFDRIQRLEKHIDDIRKAVGE